jgi:hypothetical protein
MNRHARAGKFFTVIWLFFRLQNSVSDVYEQLYAPINSVVLHKGKYSRLIFRHCFKQSGQIILNQHKQADIFSLLGKCISASYT